VSYSKLQFTVTILKCTDPCLLDKDPGPCFAAIKRYFFNRRTGECEQFTYGGCLGNANNFVSKLSCERTCQSNFKLVMF